MKYGKYPRSVPCIALVVAVMSLGIGTCSMADDYATKSNSGEVMFKLTPYGVENGRFVVDVKVDTHSGNLADLNLRKALTLHVGEETYQPVEEVRLGGHHSKGKLVFELDSAPASFEIKISGVRTMGDIILKWP